MATGTINNLANSAHVPTPQHYANCLPLLVTWCPGASITLGDLSGCGEGNLLAPFASLPGVQLYGIEISEERAAAARARLPGAHITRAPFEVIRVTPGTLSLVVTNPPYARLNDNRRAEYVAQSLVTRALAAGGVCITIIPARSGLDGGMVNHWAKHYHDVRCWRFDDGDADDDASFQKYTQIVLCGVRRADTIEEPDPTVKAQLQSWRYDTKKERWAGGTPPPVLPDTPIASPYEVPAAVVPPVITVMHADDSVLLSALAETGVQHTPAWRDAVTLRPGGVLARPLMPPTGPAHQAALILAGLLDGDIVEGADGAPLVLTTSTAKQSTHLPIDPEQAQKGVVQIAQIEDAPVLGVLNLRTGVVEQYVGAEAFAFLQPLLPKLAARVLERHTPLYRLDPDDWELRVVAGIGLDKQLPGADYPGLAPAQMHRVFAMRRALWEQNRAMINGEPGVGKTRQLAALIAAQAHFWQERARAFHGQRQPAWARKLRRAWRANRHLPGDAPRALPVWIAAPKRVLPTWRDELAAAYPDAEVMTIRDHRDVDRWLARCAESDAPVVVALISHSTKAATGLRWVPAVEQHYHAVVVADLNPPADLRPQLEPIQERGEIVGYRDASGAIRTTLKKEPRYRCPDCRMVVQDVPRGKANLGDDSAEPVTSITYFEKRRRWCAHCGAALWTIAKTEARERRYPHTPFAAWSRAAATPLETTGEMPQRIEPDGSTGPACPDSFSPYAYAYRKYRGCMALALVDESHNGRGAATDIAHAHHQMQLASQCRVLASGTHTGGELRHIFHYLFRFNPRFWLRLGLGWGDVERAVARYGVVQEFTIEHESDARRGSGAVDRTTRLIEVPGMSAALLPHLLSELVFIGVLDVGAYMPKLTELPVLVPMDDPALDERLIAAEVELREARETLEQLTETTLEDDPEAEAQLAVATAQLEAARANAEAVVQWVDRRDLAGHHHAIMAKLDAEARKRNQAAMLAKGTLPRFWSVLPMEHPRFQVYQKVRDRWGNVTGEKLLIAAPVLASDHEYPLERKTRELVTAERAQGRRVLVYVEQNDTRVTSRRYAQVLGTFRPWCLPRMDPEERERAIRQAVREGATVVICPYTHVSEGLNLQHEFETIIWVELAQSHFLRDQASRRIWRLGKQFDPSVPEAAREVRVYYLAYAGTAAHRKLHKLGWQNGAALLFAGDTPEGALVEQAGADRGALAQISRGVALGEEEDETALGDQADLQSAFAQRNADRHATLQRGRAWIGVVDTLPQRLAQLRAGQVALVAAPLVDAAAPAPMLETVPAPVTVAEPEPAEERAVAATVEPSAPATRPTRWGQPAAPRTRRKPAEVPSNQLSFGW
ncbi:MAG TPA: DUF6094 domain-containing protein [Roseiflexaceae bacterium]|nr:DUF6094 domain-containing protein [Roseiflexaceae bacterium]